MAQSFQDLQVWHRAIELSVAVYTLTSTFPQDQKYGLTSQLQRAAVSVASNIAEGRGRLTQGEFRHFLGMAQGSNYELQTQIIIARKLGFGLKERLNSTEALSQEVGRMLSSFIATVEEKQARS